MGQVFYRPTSRRDFLKTSLVSAATLVTIGGCGSGSRSAGRQSSEPVRWAFLADTHIPVNRQENYNHSYPCRNLEQIVPQLTAARLDGVSIAGDLARLEGKVGDYKVLKEILTPAAEQTPVFMALGNHDDRDNFYSVFTELPGERPNVGKHVTVVETPTVRILMLDSLMFVNRTPGLLGIAQRNWLTKYLAQNSEKPTILCFHHTLDDRDGDLLDVPRLFKIIEPARNVKAIVYGHSHVYRFSTFEGIHLINVPASGYCFGEGVPVGWVEASLTDRGGRFTLHAIAADTSEDGSVTELRWRT